MVKHVNRVVSPLRNISTCVSEHRLMCWYIILLLLLHLCITQRKQMAFVACSSGCVILHVRMYASEGMPVRMLVSV